MKTFLKCALAASMLIGTAGISSAAVRIGFDLGNVAVGYSDGYWDNDNHWHRWAHRADMNNWRQAHADQYHAYRHDDKRHHDN